MKETMLERQNPQRALEDEREAEDDQLPAQTTAQQRKQRQSLHRRVNIRKAFGGSG